MGIKSIFNNEDLQKEVVNFVKEIEGDKLYEHKMLALNNLMTVKRPYDKDFSHNAHNMLSNLYIKKLDFIKEAKTKGDIKEILNSSPIISYGSEVREGKFYIIEEELVMWSLTSFQGPLNSVGYERYMKVFKEYFGENILDVV